jgi:hypothetical protein
MVILRDAVKLYSTMLAQYGSICSAVKTVIYEKSALIQEKIEKYGIFFIIACITGYLRSESLLFHG